MKRVSEYRVTWSGEGEYVATCPEHPEITGESIAEKLEWVTGRAGLDDHSPG